MSEEVVEKKSFSQKMKEKRNKPKSKARIIIEWVLFGIFGVAFAFVLAGNIDAMIHKKDNYGQSIRFGIGSFIVLTNSMEPEYPVNSSIITYKENADKIYSQFTSSKEAVIDITFMNINSGCYVEPDTEEFKHGQAIYTNMVMTHRIREIHKDDTKELGKGKYIFITSGINTGGESSKEGQYQMFTEAQILGVVKYNSVFIGKVFGFVSSAYGLIILLLIPAAYLIITSGLDIYRAVSEKEEAEEAAGSNGEAKVDGLSDKDRERLKQELLQEMIEKKKKGDDKKDA